MEPTRHRTLGRFLLALLATLMMTPVLAAEPVAVPGGGIHELPLAVDAPDGLAARAAAVGIEPANVEAMRGMRVRIVPLDQLPPEAVERDPVAGRHITIVGTQQPGRDAVYLTLDIEADELPDGVVGYRVTVDGAERPGGPVRKPPTWVVFNVYYGGGNEIGVESIVRCHTAWMWTQLATWTNVLFNHTNCPGHGARYFSPGSFTQIQTQFDGAYYTVFTTWRNSSTDVWVFEPGGIDP